MLTPYLDIPRLMWNEPGAPARWTRTRVEMKRDMKEALKKINKELRAQFWFRVYWAIRSPRSYWRCRNYQQ